MKILLTGATGYIGKRLLVTLREQDHSIDCVVRDHRRFPIDQQWLDSKKVRVIEADLLEKTTLDKLDKDYDVAFYLVHSMSGTGDFSEKEQLMAENFRDFLNSSAIQQCIYLSGIVNEKELSKHLESRLNTEKILLESQVPLTTLRAGIIIGSGSASFEIIRDLVEKLPVMVTPKWLKTRCQPIAIRNVMQYLQGVMLQTETFNKSFDIAGPDILTYKEMLLQYAKVRGLWRAIITLPVMTPRLSSYWLFFVTSTSYRLAVSLVNSMHIDVVAEDNAIEPIVPIEKISYINALEMALGRIQDNEVVSSWKDAVSSGIVNTNYSDFVKVPVAGCFKDITEVPFPNEFTDEVVHNLWCIGGENGWHSLNWAWRLRGIFDKLIGGVGLRRGRRNAEELEPGDPLDFWRVLVADKPNKRLLLFAEMKLPGEAWLEFKVDTIGDVRVLRQEATFRPKGLGGRIYWWLMYPFHLLIFPQMAKSIAEIRD
ncbi:MAG: SDR family oxidoreductase [Saprospiraceae bacterium]|nr:SDR family oxidoreductase [Saprospiraceae bacterium]